MYKHFFKRLIDFTIALVALSIIWPFLLIVTIWLHFANKGAGDVFVLPTYREGFGSSVIEASALGLPVICSDAYGVMDAMVDDVTGLRCRVGDIDSLLSAMQTLANDKKNRSA